MGSADREATPAGHRILPHTADLILEAWAPTREECLTEAVAGLTDSFADASSTTATGRHRFRLAAGTDQQVLVSLLEEALYVLDALGAVPVDTHLDPALGAELAGWFAVADVEHIELVGSVPKGIALSGLSIGEVDGQWHCTVTVDV